MAKFEAYSDASSKGMNDREKYGLSDVFKKEIDHHDGVVITIS